MKITHIRVIDANTLELEFDQAVTPGTACGQIDWYNDISGTNQYATDLVPQSKYTGLMATPYTMDVGGGEELINISTGGGTWGNRTIANLDAITTEPN